MLAISRDDSFMYSVVLDQELTEASNTLSSSYVNSVDLDQIAVAPSDMDLICFQKSTSCYLSHGRVHELLIILRHQRNDHVCQRDLRRVILHC